MAASSGIGGVSSLQAQRDAANGIGQYNPFANVQGPATADPTPSTNTSTTQAPVGGPMEGLLGAGPAPTGPAPVSGAVSGTETAGTVGGAVAGSDPNIPVLFSGPNALRQGIGQRNPPSLAPALTGLRSIY